jgi:hypothetical protein
MPRKRIGSIRSCRTRCVLLRDRRDHPVDGGNRAVEHQVFKKIRRRRRRQQSVTFLRLVRRLSWPNAHLHSFGSPGIIYTPTCGPIFGPAEVKFDSLALAWPSNGPSLLPVLRLASGRLALAPVRDGHKSNRGPKGSSGWRNSQPHPVIRLSGFLINIDGANLARSNSNRSRDPARPRGEPPPQAADRRAAGKGRKRPTSETDHSMAE